MRKILPFVLLILWGSCTVQKYMTSINAKIDPIEFPTYPNFYLSDSADVDFEYQDLGKIYSRVVFDYDENKKGLNISDHYTSNPKKVLDLLHENAVNIGADGLISVQLEYIPTIPPSALSSGTAIKMKSNTVQRSGNK